MVIKRHTIDLSGNLAYPTTDGRFIQFNLNDKYDVQYNFQLTVYDQDLSNDLPTDVLEKRIWLADNQGKIWTTSIKFTTDTLVNYIYNFAADSAPQSVINLSPLSQKRFKNHLILENIHCGNDDRIYRKLLLENDILTVKFHYTVMTFDLAIIEDNFLQVQGIYKSSIRVRLRENSLFDVDGKPIPTIEFMIDPVVLWNANTALFDQDEQSWSDSLLSIPIIFEPTDQKGDFTQSNVTIIDSNC